MSEENKTPEENLPALVKAAPELLPVWDWWQKEGKSTLMMLVLAAVVAVGIIGYRNYSRNRLAAANQQLVNAYNVEELETAVSNFGSTKVGPELRMRLAKAYFDAERYQDALNVYDVLVAKASKNEAFADVAVLGRGHALEGLGKYKEAQEVFAGFAKANTNSFLLLDAKLGAARCQALTGDKDGAVKALDALKKTVGDDKLAEMRVERLTDAVKRYDAKRPARSLFDAADAAEKAISAEKKPEAPKAEVVKAEAPKVEAPKTEAPKAEAPKAK